MTYQPLPARQVQIGAPLPWDVYDVAGKLLLRKGALIARESQRDLLLVRGLFVDDALIRGSTGAARHAEPERYDPFRLWESLVSELEVLLREIRTQTDFPAQLVSLADLLRTLTARSADTALAAMILTDQRRYAIVHSLHVAILAELVATRLGWSEARRVSLICAGMTMNMAMIDLQTQLCAQRSAPSATQRREIERHPQLADEMLRAAGVSDETWLRAVREHHERNGGGGYPFGITAPSEEAKLLQTADIFSAKVSPRAARAPITPQEAARSLYLESGQGAKNPYVAVLIKEVGIFPPGTFVQLANGETGIVLRRGEAANTPQVLSLLSATGLSYDKPVSRDTALSPYAVSRVMPRDKVRVHFSIEKVWRA